MVDYETFIEYYSVVLRNSLHRLIEKCHSTNYNSILKRKRKNIRYISNNSYLNYLSSRQSEYKNSNSKIISRSRGRSSYGTKNISSKFTSDTRYKSKLRSNEKNNSISNEKSNEKLNSKSTNEEFKKMLNDFKIRLNSSERGNNSTNQEEQFKKIEKCLSLAVYEYTKTNINLLFNLSLNFMDKSFTEVLKKKEIIKQILGEYISFLVYFFIKYLQNEVISTIDEKMQIKEIILTIYCLIKNSHEAGIDLILDSSKKFLEFFEEYITRLYDSNIKFMIQERWDSIGTMKIHFNGKISKFKFYQLS